MTPDSLRAVLAVLGLSVPEAAKLFEVEQRSVFRRLAGTIRIPFAVETVLAIMVTVGLTPAEVKELVAHARLAFNERRRVSR